MARKRTKPRPAARGSVHVDVGPVVAARLRAFAGFHGRTLADVVAEGIRLATRGFSASQTASQTAETPVKLHDEGGPEGGRGGERSGEAAA